MSRVVIPTERPPALLCASVAPLSALLLALLLAASGCRAHPLAATSEAAADVAVARYVSQGEAAIPELRQLAISGEPRLAARARRALGKITGQWGSLGDGIRWRRSVAEAVNGDRPLLVLHLFGNFDEEFC